MCSDDDLRAIVHGHQMRWSPQSMSTCRRVAQRTSRASSLDTSTHSHSAVFSSSVESLAQFPVFQPTHDVEQHPSPSDYSDFAESQPSSSAAPSNSASTQPHRKVGPVIYLAPPGKGVNTPKILGTPPRRCTPTGGV